jgi:uncharacterized protein (TIGR02271 family)
MTMQTITALFNTRADAERAAADLASSGLDRSRLQIHAADPGTDVSTSSASSTGDNKGFLASLRDLFLPAEDHATYAEGVRRGGVVISAQVDQAQAEHVMNALEQAGAVDLETEETTWRQQGWTGHSTGSSTAATAISPAPAPDSAVAASTGTTVSSTTGAQRDDLSPPPQEEVIPIVEERLQVGKREVVHGRVRVRSFVVERPVQEQVTLHQEHVDVERRTVDRLVTDTDQLFQERTIEATERAEEAVVAKEARVTEEVVISKTAEDQTKTISDTVRRTEVEIEDNRTAGAARVTDASIERSSTQSGGTTSGRSGTPERNPGAA